MSTFTRVRRLGYDAEADTYTTTVSTLTGLCTQTPGRPKRYAELGLVESDAPTLFFVPDTYGDVPEPGDFVEWVNENYTVRDVEPVAPDGVVICARLIVEK